MAITKNITPINTLETTKSIVSLCVLSTVFIYFSYRLLYFTKKTDLEKILPILELKFRY